MKINFAKIFLFLLFSFSAQMFSQSTPETVRIDAPVSVAVDSPFEISIVHNFEGNAKEESFFDLKLPDGVNLEKAVLRNGKTEENLSFEENGSTVKVKLMPDDSSIDFFSPAQIVFRFSARATEPEEIELSFYSDENFAEWTEIVPIDFYFISEKSGRAAKLTKSSKIFIQPDGEFEAENLTIEFWGKLDSGVGEFFSIVNKYSSDTLFAIGNGELNILACQSSCAETLCEAFLSPENWYHFAVEILRSENELNFFVNGEKVVNKNLFESFDFNDLIFEFGNEKESKVFYIDELHVWESESAIVESLEKNRNYDLVTNENGERILNIGFDDENEFSEKRQNFNFLFAGVTLEDSDAPLFSRAPSIDVEQFSGYNLISWRSKDEKNVSEFVVEKSLSDGKYEEIFSKESSGEDAEYFYSDYRDSEEDVVYYRVKQISKDGSVVYSPSVKIGLRELKEFEIIQNFPNPFNPSTNISLNILVAGEYRIRVYNVTGKVVADLENGFLSTGTREYTFNGAGLTSGIYFFEVKSQTSVRAIKMIMTK